jgi:hypothetical protein
MIIDGVMSDVDVGELYGPLRERALARVDVALTCQPASPLTVL